MIIYTSIIIEKKNSQSTLWLILKSSAVDINEYKLVIQLDVYQHPKQKH